MALQLVPATHSLAHMWTSIWLILPVATLLSGCGADRLPAGGRDAAAQPDGPGRRPDGPGRPDAAGRPDGRRADAGPIGDAGRQPDAPAECRNPVEGTMCLSEGLICPSSCTDRCQFCNLWTCSGHLWTRLEAFPDPACRQDGGLRDGGSPSPDAARTCGSAGASTVGAPNIEISLGGIPCVFTLAQVAAGVRLSYGVTLPTTTPGVIPLPSDAGSCGRPGPSGLVLFETIEGAGQRYCLCDVGLCPPAPRDPITLQTGGWSGEFQWAGRNWSGPSDTNNPLGAPFPPGQYTFKVSTRGLRRTAAGDVPFEVSVSRELFLVP